MPSTPRRPANVSLRTKLLGLSLLFLALVVVGNGITMRSLATQRGALAVTKAAGDVAMLSQHLPKDLYDWFCGSSAADEFKEEIPVNLKRADRLLAGLRNGDAELGIVPVQDPELRRLVTEASDRWEQLEKELLALIELRTRPASDKQVNTLLRELSATNEVILEDLEKVSASYEATARSAVSNLYYVLGALIALGALLSMLAFGLANAWISRPIARILHACESMGRGDLTPRLSTTGSEHSRDEIERLSAALDRSLEQLCATMDSFRASAEALTVESKQVTELSASLASTATETSAQATNVTSASDEVSKNVQTVAAGAEEMTATISEISKNASNAARVASNAVQLSDAASATVQRLDESAAKISEVVKVITSVAEQTNLLALNATIEAARAGEAGKGFAVVANEVKELAKETAKATEYISQQILAIQGDTKNSVDAIGKVSQVIKEIHDFQNTIASAVEEQSATTNEMGRSISQAAEGVGSIAQNISGLAEAAESTSRSAESSREESRKLAAVATQIRTSVEVFRTRA